MLGDEGYFESQLVENVCRKKTTWFKSCDKVQFQALVQEQIQVVGGSSSVFNKIHQGMTKEGYWDDKVFDPFFITERCALFEWRKKFARSFGKDIFKDSVGENFAYFMLEMSTPIEKQPTKSFKFCGFEDCFCCSADWPANLALEDVFSRRYMKAMLRLGFKDNFIYEYESLKDDQEEFIRSYDRFQDFSINDFHFNMTAHQIVEFNLTSPKTLLEQCIKVIKRYEVPFTDQDIPSTLKKKVDVGLYSPGDEPPDMITKKGKKMFASLCKTYLSVFSDPDLVFLCATLGEFRGLGEIYDNVYDEVKEEFQGLVDMYENIYK